MGNLAQEDVITEFVRSEEFQLTYGDLDNADFVELLFTNVLPENMDAQGRADFTNALNSGTLTRETMVAEFVDTFEFVYDTEAGDANIILDFTSGIDGLDLCDNADFDTFVEIMAARSQVGLDAVFDFGGGNTLTLEGVMLSELKEGDFGFGGCVGNSKPSDAATAVITQFSQAEVEAVSDIADFELYDMFGREVTSQPRPKYISDSYRSTSVT